MREWLLLASGAAIGIALGGLVAWLVKRKLKRASP